MLILLSVLAGDASGKAPPAVKTAHSVHTKTMLNKTLLKEIYISLYIFLIN